MSENPATNDTEIQKVLAHNDKLQIFNERMWALSKSTMGFKHDLRDLTNPRVSMETNGMVYLPWGYGMISSAGDHLDSAPTIAKYHRIKEEVPGAFRQRVEALTSFVATLRPTQEELQAVADDDDKIRSLILDPAVLHDIRRTDLVVDDQMPVWLLSLRETDFQYLFDHLEKDTLPHALTSDEEMIRIFQEKSGALSAFISEGLKRMQDPKQMTQIILPKSGHPLASQYITETQSARGFMVDSSIYEEGFTMEKIFNEIEDKYEKSA